MATISRPGSRGMPLHPVDMAPEAARPPGHRCPRKRPRPARDFTRRPSPAEVAQTGRRRLHETKAQAAFSGSFGQVRQVVLCPGLGQHADGPGGRDIFAAVGVQHGLDVSAGKLGRCQVLGHEQRVLDDVGPSSARWNGRRLPLSQSRRPTRLGGATTWTCRLGIRWQRAPP